MTTLFSFVDDRYSNLEGITFTLAVDEDGKFYKYENDKEHLECIDSIVWLVNQLKDYLDRVMSNRPYKRARTRLVNSVEDLYLCDRALEGIHTTMYVWKDGTWVEE